METSQLQPANSGNRALAWDMKASVGANASSLRTSLGGLPYVKDRRARVANLYGQNNQSANTGTPLAAPAASRSDNGIGTRISVEHLPSSDSGHEAMTVTRIGSVEGQII
jgi:hypothetical protein